ncbi:MAG: division/cell wall cluster transcriptional repressor MraZ [Alphaproteobacteria bacterium]
MVVFTGTYPFKLDRKGRVSLPASFRGALQDADRFFLFPSPNHSALEACSIDFMEKLQNAVIAQADIFSKQEDSMSWLFAESRDINIDDTGRFIIPNDFLSYADLVLDGKLFFVGHGTRFFIWNETHLHQYKKKRTPLKNLKLVSSAPS